MRERNSKNSSDNDIALWARPLIWAGGTLLSRPRDSALTIAAAVAAGAIVVNSLYLQPGPHPAPIFALKRLPAPVADTSTAIVAAPKPRVVEAAPIEQPAQPQRAVALPQPAPRPKDQIAELLGSPQPSGRVAKAEPVALTPLAPIPQAAPQPAGNQLTAIQRRLSEFGYGPVPLNGVDGPDTRAAIERFERSRGMTPTGKVSDKLVKEISAMSGRPL